MKTVLISAVLLLTLVAKGQSEKNPYPKTITVSGSAEMDIIPNEITVQIELKEYDKKGQGKISIDKIKQDFLSGLKSLGLPDTAISIAGYDGINGNPWLLKKRKKEELYASITYYLKIRSSKQLDEIVDRLDDNATQNFFIVNTSHSKINEYRKQLKIQAIKAAKEKAKYLAEAIDEHIGEAVTINEPNEYFVPYGVSNTMLRSKVSGLENNSDQTEVDFRKIKLKYDVSVVFALK
jgi:uncharacterized protein YggE